MSRRQIGRSRVTLRSTRATAGSYGRER